MVRSSDASAALFPLYGNGEFRRVVVDIAVPTILTPKETHPSSADRSTLGFGHEAHVTPSGPETGRVVRHLRSVENGSREGLTAGRDKQRLVEHVVEQRRHPVSEAHGLAGRCGLLCEEPPEVPEAAWM